MIHPIDVRPTKLLIIKGNGVIGVQGESDVTKLKFIFPPCLGGKPITEYQKELCTTTAKKSFSRSISDTGIVVIDKEMTTGTWADMYVQLVNSDGEVVWKTRSRRFFFKDNPKTSQSTDDEEPEEPEPPTEEHECVVIMGVVGVPEVSDLTNRGAPIKIIIPRGKIIKRIPFGEVNFAEGPISIEGNICPEYQVGTDIETANIIIPMDPFITWNLLIGRLPPEVEPPYPEE